VSNSIPIVAGTSVFKTAFGFVRRHTRQVFPTPLREGWRGLLREEEEKRTRERRMVRRLDITV
jgi:hypothetical protein